jgi:thymidylate synthase
MHRVGSDRNLGDFSHNLNLSSSLCSNSEELQYLDLMERILRRGVRKDNRTGIATKSIFGNLMRFNLNGSDGKKIVPLITTKHVIYRLIVEELLWFLSGSTDAKDLDAKKVKIWNPNTTRSSLDKLGFTSRREGDCGPNYGFNWIHFGASYIDCDTDYTDLGVNQVQAVQNSLIRDPYSRRHIISAWNPANVHQATLPPCHMFCQFNVEPCDETKPDGEKYLDCAVYQRSADVPLGVPFNIASYATLTHIMASLTDMRPRELIYFTGDTHIYENQAEGCETQLSRTPFAFPTLLLTQHNDYRDYRWHDFKLENYEHHPTIEFPFAV